MTFVDQIINFLNFSKYAIVFIGCIVEGPVVMLISGFLLKIGQFDLFPLYLSLMSGDFTADVIWYGVGRFGARRFINRFGRYFKITEEIILKIEECFKMHQEKILFISKITMGFGFSLVVLIVAGIMRVPFKKYITLNLLGGFIWTGFLILIGYLFGNIYDFLPNNFKFYFIIFSIILVIFSLWILNKYFIKKEKTI